MLIIKRRYVLEPKKFSKVKQQSYTHALKKKKKTPTLFKVLYTSDSLISMQFSKRVKLPQVFQPQL